MKYDLSDVKSVQKFLLQMKGFADSINGALPEDSKVTFDYDEFTENFYKANEGILQNRDTIKQEKLKAVEDFATYKTSMEEKWGKVDQNIVTKYNAAVEELTSLKEVIKENDGGFDIDKLKSRHASEIAEKEKEFEAKFLEDKKPLEAELEKLVTAVGTYKGKYFSKLKKEAVENELARINVNPEDKSLILQANLGRAEIAETDGDNFTVVFKEEGKDSIPLSKYWDAWASDAKHQKYILSADNSGGGSAGANSNAGPSVKDKLIAQLDDPKITLKDRLILSEKLAKMHAEK